MAGIINPATGKNNFPYGAPRNVPTNITFRAGGIAELRKKIQAFTRDARKLSQASTRVNEEATAWMARESTKELRAAIAGGGREQHTKRNLEDVTADHKINSSWTRDGFVFYDKDKMAKTVVKDYYRVIERGDKQRYLQYDVPLVFFRGGRAFGASKERRGDLGVYAPNSNFPNVRVIRHDFGGYHYVQRARERFMQEKIYRGLISTEVTKLQTLGRTFRLGGIKFTVSY